MPNSELEWSFLSVDGTKTRDLFIALKQSFPEILFTFRCLWNMIFVISCPLEQEQATSQVRKVWRKKCVKTATKPILCV